MRWNILMLSFSISFTPISLYAAVYKWTDNDGNIHYSQERPGHIQSKRMKIAPPPQDISTYKKPSLRKKEAADNQNNGKNSDKNNRQADHKRSTNKQDTGCKAAKLTLKKLLSSGRVRKKDKNGNLSYMSDKQKQQRIKQEKDFITQNCK